MVAIVTRAGKGSELTHNEVDTNFNNLNNGKQDVGTAAATVNAAGTTQGTATALTADVNTVTEAAIGAGVLLPTASTDKKIYVINKTKITLSIYPAVGAAINDLATNAAVTLPSDGFMFFAADTNLSWRSTADISPANTFGINTGDETGGRMATLLHAAGVKAVLVDADEVNSTDSAASFTLIRTTWSDVKAFLKTYFDNIYNNTSFRNRVINGWFVVNQRKISGTAILAAGAYGHDGWKAGSSGCTYTFATTNNVTTLAISAGSLKQIILGEDLQSGTHVLSWEGTAQGKIDAGSYSTSGVTGTLTGGTDASIEFNIGTLRKVQFEPGTTASVAEIRGDDRERCCYRYYRINATDTTANSGPVGIGFAQTTTAGKTYIPFPYRMRSVPTSLQQSGTAADYKMILAVGGSTVCSAVPTFSNGSTVGCDVNWTIAAGATAGNGCFLSFNAATGYLAWSREP